MTYTMTETIVAAVLVIVAFSLLAWFIRRKRAHTLFRMNSMLERAGVDPELIESADHAAIIKAIRRRCSRCQAEDVCDRWLAGRYEGSASFCPNEEVIAVLSKLSVETSGGKSFRSAA
ncbi:MAG: hypothetical protein GWM87_03575 [Xanthomonadales bacterium]|nr:hypothetical protein [Xanthomonadales bacterium]NIX12117.1 hypothetical protein [Xanthomonadales bacterium]